MKELGIIFSGQGSQYPGMYKDLISLYPEGKYLFEKASTICDLDLIDLCSNAPENTLRETRIAQLSTVVYSIAVYKYFLKENGILPKFFAGHSVGEYSALIAAKVLSFEEGIHLVNRRGELMQNYVKKGGMLAIIDGNVLDIEDYCKNHSSLEDEIVVSNYNSDNQIIISGTTNQISKAKTYFEGLNISVKPLNVSGGFHSPLMRSIEEPFAKELTQCNFYPNINTIFSNVDAEPYENEDDIRLKLKMQLSKPVLWNNIMHALRRSQVETIIECGPQKTLTNLFRNVSGIEAYSYLRESEHVRQLLHEKYSCSKCIKDLIERGLTIIACTYNYNDDLETYQNEVIENGKKLRKLSKNYQIEEFDRLLIQEIISCLLKMLNGKKISSDEQRDRLLQWKNDTSNIKLQTILEEELKRFY